MPRVRDTLVRSFSSADLPFAFALSSQVFGAYSRNPDATLRGILRDPGVMGLVAEREGSAAGFVLFRVTRLGRAFGPWEDPARGYVDAIAVDPGAHGRGLGSALLAEAERIARARGAVAMSLMTALSNQRALRLFHSAGYHQLYVQPNAYRGGKDSVVMLRPLGG
jgi:ribosomal protein S18 acetylase RimI-like enzyme